MADPRVVRLMYPVLRDIPLGGRGAPRTPEPPRPSPAPAGPSTAESSTTPPASDIPRAPDGGRPAEVPSSAAEEAPAPEPAALPPTPDTAPREEAPTPPAGEPLYAVREANCPRSFSALSTRQEGVLRDFVTMLRRAQVETHSPLLSYLADHPRDLAAHFLVESGLSWSARGRERPHRDDPEGRARYSYGIAQIIDTNARGLYETRHRLGNLARLIPEPPPAPADGWDSGISGWRETLADQDGGWYAVLWLLRFEDWLNAYFDERRLLAADELRSSARTLSGGALESRRVIIDFMEGLETATPHWLALLRLFGAASSLAGVRSMIIGGGWQRSLACLQKAWVAINGGRA